MGMDTGFRDIEGFLSDKYFEKAVRSSRGTRLIITAEIISDHTCTIFSRTEHVEISRCLRILLRRRLLLRLLSQVQYSWTISVYCMVFVVEYDPIQSNGVLKKKYYSYRNL